MIFLLIHAHHWHWNHPLSCQITNCVPTFWCRLPLQEFNVILLTSLVSIKQTPDGPRYAVLNHSLSWPGLLCGLGETPSPPPLAGHMTFHLIWTAEDRFLSKMELNNNSHQHHGGNCITRISNNFLPMTGCTEQQVSLRNMVRQRMSHFSPQQQTEQQVFPKDTTTEQQDSH